MVWLKGLFVCLSFVVAKPLEEDKYEMKNVYVIQRHGTRASTTIFEHLIHAKHAEKNFVQPQELHVDSSTKLFRSQVENVWQPLFKNFLNLNTNDKSEWLEQVRIQSTDTDRTRGSAALLMRNLFPNISEKTIQKHLKFVPRDQDYLLYTTFKTCRLMKKLMIYVKNSQEGRLVNKFKNYLLSKYLGILKTDIGKGVSSMIVKAQSEGKKLYSIRGKLEKENPDLLLKVFGDQIC